MFRGGVHETFESTANRIGRHTEGRYGISTLGRGVSDGQGETCSAGSETIRSDNRTRR